MNNMVSYRIIKVSSCFDGVWYFPEYYIKPYFFRLLGGLGKDLKKIGDVIL